MKLIDILYSSENGLSIQEDSLTLALWEREGVRVFMVEGEA